MSKCSCGKAGREWLMLGKDSPDMCKTCAVAAVMEDFDQFIEDVEYEHDKCRNCGWTIERLLNQINAMKGEAVNA